MLAGQLTFLLVGMVGAWSYHCFLSDPTMTEHFYQYSADDPGSHPAHPHLWSNILNIITITRLSSNFVSQVFNISPLCRSRSMFRRIYVGIALISLVLCTPIIMTVAHTNELLTFALLLTAVGVSGIATGLQQATLFSLGSLFPELGFTQSALVGMGVAASLASIAKVATKSAFRNTFADHLSEARMYYGLGLVVIVVATVALWLFSRTSLARRRIAELSIASPSATTPLVVAVVTQEDDIERSDTINETSQTSGNNMKSVVWCVVRSLPWLASANTLLFVASFAVFPGVLSRIRRHDTWFNIYVVLAFQVALTVGRFAARYVARIGGDVLLDGRLISALCALRAAVFVPLFVFGFAKGMGSRAGAYTAVALCQLSAGLLSGLIAIAVPLHPALVTPDLKAAAGNALSLTILSASVVGTLANLAVCHWYLD